MPALTCGILDYQRETSVDELLTSLELDGSARRMNASLGNGGVAEVVDLETGGVRVSIMPTTFSRAERSPSPREGGLFLDLVDQVLHRFRPQALLTYGGHAVSLELMRRRGRVGRRSSFTCTTSATTTAGGSPTLPRSCSLPSIRGDTTAARSAWRGR